MTYGDYHQEIVIILDFGSQYTQLIARRVRELGVYCEIVPFNTSIEKIRSAKPVGIILSGGPRSVNEEDAPLATRLFSAWARPCSASATEYN